MSIDAIRYRAEGAMVVLQVLESFERSQYEYRDKTEWRDATVEDLLQVARYTRAHDALDRDISSLRAMVESVQQEMRESRDASGLAPNSVHEYWPAGR
jgi:K+-sensing histidine kinase KdpD